MYSEDIEMRKNNLLNVDTLSNYLISHYIRHLRLSSNLILCIKFLMMYTLGLVYLLLRSYIYSDNIKTYTVALSEFPGKR